MYLHSIAQNRILCYLPILLFISFIDSSNVICSPSKCYLYSSISMTKNDAVEFCGLYGMTIPHITCPTENNFIYKSFVDKYKKNVWITSTGHLPYQNWFDEKDKGSKCAVINDCEKWVPAECESKQGVVCSTDRTRLRCSCDGIHNNYCYLYFNESSSFEVAKQRCEHIGGKSLVLNNENEANFIFAQFMYSSIYNIILNIQKKGSHFIDASTKKPIDFDLWGRFEPSHKQCAEYKGCGYMKAIPCDMKRHYICEFKIKNNTVCAKLRN